MSKRQGHGGQAFSGRVHDHHRVALPRFAGPLVPNAAPEVHDLSAAVIDAAGAAQLATADEILGERVTHALEAVVDRSLNVDGTLAIHRLPPGPSVALRRTVATAGTAPFAHPVPLSESKSPSRH